MKNVSKKIQYLFLIGAMLSAAPQKASAFGFFPPTPPEVVVDIPDDAGKIVSNINSAIRQLQTYYSKLQTLDLDALKGMLDVAFSITKPKAVGRGEAKAAQIGDVSISSDEDMLSEEKFFDAYTKLFFVYPEAPKGENIPSTAVRTAYRHKGIEYEQDVLIDTYVTGRITEDYLALVEKTVDRLGKCQAGTDTSNCKFFGMEFSDVPTMSQTAPSGPEEDNGGQLGITTNSYIITTMYDRLIRVIEDLTATEAIYKASRQNELVRPTATNSDASDYINPKYQFAYHQTKDNVYAKAMVSKFKASDCDGSKPGCAEASNTKADIKTMDPAEILGKLQQIDQWQQNAVILHNLKVQLPEYKTLYRKYLMALEVHKKALENLKQTDQCVVDFLNTYKTSDVKWDNSNNRWGGVTKYEDLVAKNNEYKDRSGLSAELIQEYQTEANETIMDLSESENMEDRCKAMGYRTECSDGYVKDTSKHCIITKEVEQSDGTIVLDTVYENEAMNPCLVDSVEMDTGAMENASDLSNINASDYMKDNEAEDRIALEGRIKAEKTWRIGQEKMMALTESGKLKFDPWNDQKNLQEMYLKKKYNNMKTIIEATDDAVNSFKIAANRISGLNYSGADEMIKTELQTIVRNASACISPNDNGAVLGHAKVTQFKEDAKVAACAGKENCSVTGINCTNAGNSSAGTTTVTCAISFKETKHNYIPQYDDEGNYIGSTDSPYVATGSTNISNTWTQHVNVAGSACDLTQAGSSYDDFNEDTSCPGNWNLLPGFLVKNYFKAILGGCRGTLEEQAKFMHDNANSKYRGETRGKDQGRIVAWDKLADVIAKRIENDEKVKEFVQKYNRAQDLRKKNLESEKKKLDELNNSIDEVTKLKNGANKQLNRSKDRIASIGEEIAYLNKQKGLVGSNDAQLCAINVKIFKLEFERAALQGENAPTWGGAQQTACNNARKGNPNFEEDKKAVQGLKASDFVISFNTIYNDTTNKKESRHVKPSEAEEQVKLADSKLDGLKINRDAQKEKIEKIQDEITLAASCFASPEDNGVKIECNRKVPGSYSYIVVATESQENLDSANASYEKFIDGDARMQWTKVDKCRRPLFGRRVCSPKDQWATDNLAATMTQYLYNKGKIADENKLVNAIKEIVQADLRKTWTGDDKIGGVVSALKARKVPSNFYIKGFEGMVVPFTTGDITVETIVRTFRDVAEQYAVNQLQQEISNADKVIQEEREAAVQKIEAYMLQLGISDNSSEANPAIFIHDNYKENGSMITGHNNLTSALRRPVHADSFGFVGGDMSTIWGIPENVSAPDDDYFVGLPARGNNYTGKAECRVKADGKKEGDCNAGREFTAPKKPLLNLPPLREVFYFDAKDFDDLPRNGDVPTLTSLLNLKYKPSMDFLGINDESAEKWEYMPEIWRYLLARPNTRNDGLYQQTYVEDSYGDGAIKDLLEGGTDDGYRALIGRGGVYPCTLGGKIIDVAGGDGVRDMKFGKRYGNTSMSCYEIKDGGGNKVIHLMADHNVKDVSDSEGLGNINNPSFNKYSELGQMLRFGGNRLRYRPLQKNIQEYMKSDEDDDNKNDITRRKAETATFKRNMFGSFIDAVNHEHNAKKNLDTIKQNVIDSLTGLCKQIHAQDLVVSAAGESDESCVEYIMANGGLASSTEDRAYGTGQEYNKEGRDAKDYNTLMTQGRGSFYYTLYTKLTNKEAEMLNKAENGSAAPAPAEGEDPIMCGKQKNRYCGYKDLISSYGKDTDRVKERLDSIRRYFNALNGDAAEKVVTITPTLVDKLESNLLTANAAKSSMEGEIKNAKADRTLARIKDDEAIQSMENQGQIVPYCPIYRNR